MSKKINPVKIPESEFTKLLFDKENYDKKIKELLGLLEEINLKISIVNTVKDADSLKFKAETAMREANSYKLVVSREAAKMSEDLAEKRDDLKERGELLAEVEKDWKIRVEKLDADMKSYNSLMTAMDKKIKNFELKKEKELAKMNKEAKDLKRRMDAMKDVYERAKTELELI